MAYLSVTRLSKVNTGDLIGNLEFSCVEAVKLVLFGNNHYNPRLHLKFMGSEQ